MTQARKLKPTGPNLQGAPNGTQESNLTTTRAAELQKQLGQANDFGSTMGVAVAKDTNGNEHVPVGTNRLRASGKPIVERETSAKPGDTWVRGDPHAQNHDAETNIARYAHANGFDDCRPFCDPTDVQRVWIRSRATKRWRAHLDSSHAWAFTEQTMTSKLSVSDADVELLLELALDGRKKKSLR